MNKFAIKSTKVSKHQASKKNFKHNHNWSKGQQKDIDKGLCPIGLVSKKYEYLWKRVEKKFP
jgi:hypothetical protein